MVAIIKSSGSLRNVLHYNENKLKQNVAQLVHAVNFAKDANLLNFTDKLKTIEKLTELNQRTRLNTVHISLNFSPSENLEKEMLQNISESYMQQIGFGAQPYLVYEHHDSGHPHIHIVTTNIQRDGTRISMQNIGRNQSEKARLNIEKEFNLVLGQAQQLKKVFELKPVNASKLQYGKSETRRAITGVLDAVIPSYRYSSLPELNAILRGYNVTADRGSEQSRTYQKNGLVYRVLDDQGNKVGTPIKASLIYNNPGLKFLEERFSQNQPLKHKHKVRVKNAVDLYFARNRFYNLGNMIADLRQQRIQTVLRTNDNGIVYGITYIDHQSKCVFNGSELGKPYSANMILARCTQQQPEKPQQNLKHKETRQYQDYENKKDVFASDSDTQIIQQGGLNNFIQILTQAEYEGYLPGELRKKQTQKRKRKKPHH